MIPRRFSFQSVVHSGSLWWIDMIPLENVISERVIQAHDHPGFCNGARISYRTTEISQQYHVKKEKPLF